MEDDDFLKCTCTNCVEKDEKKEDTQDIYSKYNWCTSDVYNLGTEDISNIPTILDIRESLTNLIDLVTIAHEALHHSEMTSINEIVGNVLYFYVADQLTTAEQELKKIWIKSK